MFNMGFLGIVVGVIGAKLMYYIVELPAILQDPSLLLDITNGFVVYGGIITGILAPYIYARVKKLPFLKYLDTAIPSIPLLFGGLLLRTADGCVVWRNLSGRRSCARRGLSDSDPALFQYR